MRNKSEPGGVNEQDSICTRSLHIVDDFVWVDNTLPNSQATDQYHLERNQIINIVLNVVQSDSDSIKNKEILPQIKYSEADTDAADLNTVFMEQQYWEQSGTVLGKVKSTSKAQASNRKTVKELNIIANSKIIPRHPSYYKFDDLTTSILETLPIRMGPFMNIAGKGRNSVVIYANCKLTNRIHFPDGLAVKVYKLGLDVNKNNALLKKCQKEAENLLCLISVRYTDNIPYFMYRSRNVIVTSFVGCNQETPPSIDSVPTKDSLLIYQNIVNEINRWYNQCKLVHGRLSTKNIVHLHGRPLYIGWSHSVQRQNPLALTKLIKDCHFVTKFLERRGVPVKSTEELFKEITGLDHISTKLLEVIHKKDLWKNPHIANPNRISEDNINTCRSNHRFK